jgi:TolB-like protein/tetratricopeptide (TPR) repeat protein
VDGGNSSDSNGGGKPSGDPGKHRSDFFSELKRRKVYKAGAAYLAVALALVEGASLVFPTFGLGPGVFNALVLVSVLGFPVALGLAWTFDVSGSGIQRTGPAPRGAAQAAPDRWGRAKAALVGAGFVGIVWLGVRLWQPLGEGPATGVPVDAPVLAVLPFDDFSPDGDQAYFADGLHDELLHQLAMLRGIRLTSRTSVSHFRGSPATAEAIADSLGARYVIESSVRREPDSVQLTVQLIDAMTDDHLWSESLTRAMDLEGIFDLQKTLAMRVAASLGGTLAAGVGQTLGTAPTSSLEAYHAYLRALHHWARFDIENIYAAVDDMKSAVELDPEFGRAHQKLAMFYAVLNNFAGGVQGENFPIIREHTELAMRYLPPDHPEYHMAALSIHWPMEWDWEQSRKDLENALALDPDYLDARWALAEWHGVIAGNTDRGLEIIQEVERLDPFGVQPVTVRAWILTTGQRYAEAAEVHQRLHEMMPGDPAHVLNRASCLALAGEREEALRLIQEVLAGIPSPRSVTLAVHLARAGDTVTAREILTEGVARREAGGDVAASALAAAYAAVGEIEEALDWLERCFDEEGGIYFLRGHDWRPLWGHPRFQDLWDRVGLLGDPPTR